jgi:hypothetical protein
MEDGRDSLPTSHRETYLTCTMMLAALWNLALG